VGLFVRGRDRRMGVLGIHTSKMTILAGAKNLLESGQIPSLDTNSGRALP
jgi:hypothetical protein